MKKHNLFQPSLYAYKFWLYWSNTFNSFLYHKVQILRQIHVVNTYNNSTKSKCNIMLFDSLFCARHCKEIFFKGGNFFNLPLKLCVWNRNWSVLLSWILYLCCCSVYTICYISGSFTCVAVTFTLSLLIFWIFFYLCCCSESKTGVAVLYLLSVLLFCILPMLLFRTYYLSCYSLLPKLLFWTY